MHASPQLYELRAGRFLLTVVLSRHSKLTVSFTCNAGGYLRQCAVFAGTHYLAFLLISVYMPLVSLRV